MRKKEAILRDLSSHYIRGGLKTIIVELACDFRDLLRPISEAAKLIVAEEKESLKEQGEWEKKMKG